MGYVGFPLACAIARSNKYEVWGIDIDERRINKINNRICPVEDEMAEKDIMEVNINATTEFGVLNDSDYVIICVPTPVDDNKKPDLTPVIKASEQIAKYLHKGQMIVLESTVNPGVCEEVMLPILEQTGLKGGIDFELAHCPERIWPVTEWNVYNISRNIGAMTKEGTKKAADFYRSFLNVEINEVSSIKAAEATKIVENTFRDINIAYVNELAQLFDRMGIDIVEVIKASSNKPFAFMPHFPGCGVGGHCIPVDPYYLIQKAEELGFNTQLMKTARQINNHMPSYTIEKLEKGLQKFGIQLKDAKIGLLGLSYRANMGDMRESPSLEIKKELLEKGSKVMAHDPHCNGHSDSTLKHILENCDGIIIATNHKEFMNIEDWGGKVKVIIDGRNCLENNGQIKEKNIYYAGIGRGY